MRALDKINHYTTEQFIQIFGEIFEHSPWVAQKAAMMRPFPSLEDVYETMKEIVELSPKEQQLALILEHPELGTRLQMSNASVKEQTGAGLNTLTPDEFKHISALNARYKEKFHFPFIIAVAGKNKHTIMHEMERRLSLTVTEEFQTALQEIYKIARIRFQTIVDEPTHTVH